jgi:hypothetical protein
LYGGETELKDGTAGYDEPSAAATNYSVSEGFRLMELLLGR